MRFISLLLLLAIPAFANPPTPPPDTGPHVVAGVDIVQPELALEAVDVLAAAATTFTAGVVPTATPQHGDSMKIETIAKTCHEANRAYCASIGDTSQVPWEQAPDWQRESAIKGVEAHLAGSLTPRQSHESWLAEKARTGWKYGPVKDAEKKEHPCFVPYDELPVAQQAKDAIFGAIVEALRAEVQHIGVATSVNRRDVEHHSA